MSSKLDFGAMLARQIPTEIRTIDVVTNEIMEAKRVGGQAILDIGRGLIEAKSMLKRGEWLPWLTEKVEFSERTAQTFMKLSREYSNPQTLADLGTSKALTLLAVPKEEREAFISEPHAVNGEEKLVTDMSSRQLEQVIRERDEARKRAEAAKADAQAAEQARAKMEADMALMNASLSAAQEGKKTADEAVFQLEAQLAELKAAPVDVVVMAVDQEAIDKAKAEAVAEMQDKLDKARQAGKKAEDRRKAAEEALAETQKKMEEMARAEKKADLTADKDMATFEVLITQGQELANQMRKLALKAESRGDQSAAQAMIKGLRTLLRTVERMVDDAESDCDYGSYGTCPGDETYPEWDSSCCRDFGRRSGFQGQGNGGSWRGLGGRGGVAADGGVSLPLLHQRPDGHCGGETPDQDLRRSKRSET